MQTTYCQANMFNPLAPFELLTTRQTEKQLVRMTNGRSKKLSTHGTAMASSNTRLNGKATQWSIGSSIERMISQTRLTLRVTSIPNTPISHSPAPTDYAYGSQSSILEYRHGMIYGKRTSTNGEKPLESRIRHHLHLAGARFSFRGG